MGQPGEKKISKSYHGLALFDIFLLKEELSVEIGNVYGIQV